MKSSLCKECKKEPRQGPLQSKCVKCVKKKAKEKEAKKKEKAKEKRIKHRERPAALKKKLDVLFSKYVRLRDYLKPCVTCGKPWEPNFQCGHVFSRRHLSTRWDDQNANAQCPGCNMFEGGRQYEHALATDKIWGVGTAAALHELSKRIFKGDSEWYKKAIGYYEKRIEEMGQVRNMP